MSKESSKAQTIENDIQNIENEINSRDQTSAENVQLPMLVEVEEFIQKNPLIALAIAIVLGVTVGYLIKNLKNSETFQKKVTDTLMGLVSNGNFDILNLIKNVTNKTS